MNIKFVTGLVSGFILGFCLNHYLITNSDKQPLKNTRQTLTATANLSQQDAKMRALSESLFIANNDAPNQPLNPAETSDAAPETPDNDAATNQPLQEKYAAMDAHFQSIEFTKAASELDLNNALPELTLALGLSDEQAQVLTQLLHDKNNAEIELLTPYYQSKMPDMDTNPFIDPQNEQAELDNLNLERDAINQHFTSKLSEYLNEQQISRYQQFEQQKLAQQVKFTQFFSSQSYFAMIPSLDASQKQVILDLHQHAYDEQMKNLEVRIGSFGTANPQQNELDFFQDIDMQISQVLTAEQLALKKTFQHP